MKIKNYYLDAFPNDELGKDINPDATFIGLTSALSDGDDVYDYIGVGDSIVRERVFGKLADIMGVPYNVIYKMWQKS